MAADNWLTEDQMRARVRDGLIVSIDLLIRDDRERWLLAYRKNRPARSSWFVPGGRIRKGEPISVAFERLVRFEFGVHLAYKQAQFQGVYVHYYDDNRWNDPEYGTHYLVLAHRVTVDSEWEGIIDTQAVLKQHHQLRWFDTQEALSDPDVHSYTKAYLRGVYAETGILELFPRDIHSSLSEVNRPGGSL